MNKKFLLLAPVIALLLAGCGGGSKQDSSSQTSSQESQQTSEQSSEATSTSSTSSKEQSSEQSSEQTSSKEEQSSPAESSEVLSSSESSEDLPSSEEQQSSEELPSSEEESSEELPSSEEESSESQSSEEPVGDIYYVRIGEAAPIPLTPGDELGLAEGQTGQYSAVVNNVFEGESIAFFLNSDVITNFGSDPEDEENKNLFQVVEGVYLAHNDVEETTIYFKTWQDGGYSFWATGYEKGEEPPVEETTYYVQVGEGDLVELVKDEECSLILGQTGQYVADLENLVKDEKVVFYADETAITTGIGSDPEDAENKNLIRTIEGEFVINNDADTSTVYFKTWEDGGYSFWATGYDAGEEPPVEETTYYVQVGENDPVELVEDTEYSLVENQTGQFVADLTDLVEGEEVTFYADEVAITTGIGSEPEDEENKNLIRTVVGEYEFLINNDAAESTIYFKTWVDGGYSFWATGYEEGEEPEPDVPSEEGYYVVSSTTNWKFEGAPKMGDGTGDNVAEIIGYEAAAKEEIKIRGYHDGVATWYNMPDSMDNYVVGDEPEVLDIYLNKEYKVYFAPHHEPGEKYDVTFYVDTTKLDSWEPAASGYFLHAWGNGGAYDTWGQATMSLVEGEEHLYSYTYSIEEGNSITGIIFAFKQSTDDKQTIDIVVDISEEGEYVITYDDAQWPGGKMQAACALKA